MVRNCFSCFTKVVLLVILAVIATSCLYRMPTENDFSTVPTTNNPGVIRESVTEAFMPGVSY